MATYHFYQHIVFLERFQLFFSRNFTAVEASYRVLFCFEQYALYLEECASVKKSNEGICAFVESEGCPIKYFIAFQTVI